MAWEYALLDLPGQIAGSTFATGNGYQSTGQFLITKLNGTNDTHVPCSAVGDRPSGIAQNNPASGGALQVRAFGVSKVVCAETLVAGDEFGPSALGKADKKFPTATGADFGNYVLGVVLEGAGLNELATVLIGMPYRI